MRQIKFRAWDKEYGHMYQNAYPFEHLVYVEMFDDDETFQQFKHKMQVINGKYFYFIIAKDIELMQFTGLQDRTGKDVYEGDIVEMFERSLFRVVWNDYYARYQLELVKGNELTKVHVPDQFQFSVIVGNIYEHPDLLAKEQ